MTKHSLLPLLLCLLIPGCMTRTQYQAWLKAPQITFATTSAIDLHQTVTCLNAGTCREINPLVPVKPNSVQGVAFKLGVTGLLIWLTQAMSNVDTPKAPMAAFWLQTGMAAAQTVVVLHNHFEVKE